MHGDAITVVPSAQLGSDGYGAELEDAYPGVRVRLDREVWRYRVTRLADGAACEGTGLQVRALCAGLTGRIDGRLDAEARSLAERVARTHGPGADQIVGVVGGEGAPPLT